MKIFYGGRYENIFPEDPQFRPSKGQLTDLLGAFYIR
jgi:hypothetical protein